jgi:flagellar L-ring protein precursor FlgH
MRLTVLVVLLYGICCAMAFGQSGSRQDAQARDVSAYRNNTTQQQSSGPLKDNGGSLIADTLSRPADPNQLKYADASILGVPEPKPREIKKHELITIIISENSDSSTNDSSDLERSGDVDAKLDSYIQLNTKTLSLHPVQPAITPEIKAEGSHDFKGTGQLQRTDTFTGRIGAEVIDVKPNGTVVLQAHKHIKNDEEEQEITLTGICRAVDVSPDNTIQSNVLHDLDVKKVTKGAAHDTAKRGWMQKLLQVIAPF